MKLDAFRVFLRVADYEHITRAAEELAITQPAVSRTIQSLERQTGLPLFERQGRRIALTEAGRVVQSYARRIAALERDLEESLQALRNLQMGEVNISASKTTSVYLLPPVIVRFRERHPHIALKLAVLNSHQVIESVLTWQADFGLVEGDISALTPELTVEVIATDELVLIVAPSHPWSRRQTVTPEMLGANILLLREQGSGSREVIEHAFQQRGVQVFPLLTVPENEMIKQLVICGVGAAILPALVVQREVAAGDVVQLPIESLDLHRQFSLVQRADKHCSRAALAFCSFLRAVIAEGRTPDQHPGSSHESRTDCVSIPT